MQMDVFNRQEEISYLRASMSRLREELDQQRRLNVCLKERKVWIDCGVGHQQVSLFHLFKYLLDCTMGLNCILELTGQSKYV